MRPVLLALALGLAAPPASAGLGPQRRLKVWRPSESILAIAQTPDRYLWLGTHAGLLRFDGVDFTTFDRSNTPALDPDRVARLVVDGTGALWVGLNVGGVVIHRGDEWRRTTGLGERELTGLVFDARGQAWAGTRLGLFRFLDGAWTQRGVPAALKDAPIEGLRTTPEGDVLVRAAGASARIGASGFAPLDDDAGSHGAWIQEQIADLLGVDRRQEAAPVARAVGGITAGLRTRTGELWLGNFAGLFAVGAAGLTRLDTAAGLPDAKVTSLAEDHEGNVWVGTMAGGLVQIQHVLASGWARRDGLRSDTVFSVIEAANGDLWATTPDGVSRRSGGRFADVPLPPGVPSWSARGLAAAPDGSVWIATLGTGLVQIDGDRARRFTTKDGLPSDYLYGVAVTRDGTLWAGASTGELVRRTGQRFERVPTGGAPCQPRRDGEATCADTVLLVVERRAGGVVAGTLRSGLIFHDAQGVTRMTPHDGVPDAMITALHEDATGALWLGTDGKGVARVKDGAVTSFAAVAGLPQRVYGLLEDGLDRLWMCSDRGVFRVARAELERSAAAGAPPPFVARYGTEDGMPSEQCHRFQPPAWRARDGGLLFATFQGVALFAPPERGSVPPPPVAVLERALLNGRAVDAASRAAIDVAPGPGALEFHYTAPTFVAVRRVRFRYRLEGFDPAWVDAGERRAAYYTNIPPGRYRFMVQALRDEDPTSVTTAALAFRLRPRFRQTVWFQALIAGLVLVAGVAVQGARRQLRRARAALVAQERNRIALDLHDNLAQVFSALGFQLDSLQKLLQRLLPGDDGVPDRVRQLRATAAHARIAARNAIFNLRWQGQQRRELGDALRELGRVYPDADITVVTEGAARPLPLVAENELLHVAQEATSNAIQHGRARQVRLELRFAQTRVELWVRDDGTGFDPGEANGRGAGIPGMRERAQRAGGRLVIESAPGTGTRIGVVIDGASEANA